LYIAGFGVVSAQGRERFPEEPNGRQFTQRNKDTPRAGHQGDRLHEEDVRFQVADGGPGRISFPDGVRFI
jgi:hypothetical protein